MASRRGVRGKELGRHHALNHVLWVRLAGDALVNTLGCISAQRGIVKSANQDAVAVQALHGNILWAMDCRMLSSPSISRPVL
jgi:hypothetical protein